MNPMNIHLAQLSADITKKIPDPKTFQKKVSKKVLTAVRDQLRTIAGPTLREAGYSGLSVGMYISAMYVKLSSSGDGIEVGLADSAPSFVKAMELGWKPPGSGNWADGLGKWDGGEADMRPVLFSKKYAGAERRAVRMQTYGTFTTIAAKVETVANATLRMREHSDRMSVSIPQVFSKGFRDAGGDHARRRLMNSAEMTNQVAQSMGHHVASHLGRTHADDRGVLSQTGDATGVGKSALLTAWPASVREGAKKLLDAVEADGGQASVALPRMPTKPMHKESIFTRMSMERLTPGKAGESRRNAFVDYQPFMRNPAQAPSAWKPNKSTHNSTQAIPAAAMGGKKYNVYSVFRMVDRQDDGVTWHSAGFKPVNMLQSPEFVDLFALHANLILKEMLA